MIVLQKQKKRVPGKISFLQELSINKKELLKKG